MSLVIRASEVKSRSIKWAWSLRLAIAYLTVMTGVESLGKSVFVAWVVARLTHGDLPGEWRDEPVNVLIVAGEDGIEDTWKPRLDLAGADLERVTFLNLSELAPDWNLRDGIDALDDALEETGAKLLFIDAALDHLPVAKSGDYSKDPVAVRSALKPLKYLVRKREIVGLYSMHPPKTRSANFRDLVQLSQAFSAVPRVGLLFDYHPDDDPDDPDRRRVVIRGKGNIGRDPGGLSFRVTGKPYRHDDGCETDRETVVEVEPCDITLADLAPDRVVGAAAAGPSKTDRATDYLREALADGQRHLADQIRGELDRQGIGSDSVVREARRRADVHTRKRRGVKDGPWEWWIPAENIDRPHLDAFPASRAMSPNPKSPSPSDSQNPSSREKKSRRPHPQHNGSPDRRRLDADALPAREANGHVSDRDLADAEAIAAKYANEHEVAR